MKIQKQIDVRLVRKGPVSSLRVVQYDTGVQLVFNVLDYDLPSGTTATLYVRKKSGKFVYQTKWITVNGNTVTVDLENQALTEHGETFYQLRFVNGEDIISTFYGSMWVDPSLADNDAVESTTVIHAFDEFTEAKIAEVQAATEEFIALAEARVADKGVEVLATIPAEYTETSRKADSAIRTKADAIICSAIGNPVAVHDSSDDYFRGLKLFGKTTQRTTTGKNLLQITAKTATVSGVTFTINDDGTVTANGTATDTATLVLNAAFPFGSGVSYALSGCPSGGGADKYRIDNADKIADDGNGAVSNYTMATEKPIRIRIAKGVTVNNLVFYPMIRLASVEDDTFEPYTGGKASPNRDYPQEFVNIGKDGNVNVAIYGKNLLNITTSGTAAGVTETVKNGRVSFSGTAMGSGGRTAWARSEVVTLAPGTYRMSMDIPSGVAPQPCLTKAGYSAVVANGCVAFNVAETIDVYLGFNYEKGITYDAQNVFVQLEYGSAQSEYEVFRGAQKIAIPTDGYFPGVPTVSGGDFTDADGQQWISDAKDFERGVYVRKIKKVALTGEEDFVTKYNGMAFTDGAGIAISHVNGSHVYCSHDAFAIGLGGEYIFFSFKSFGVTSISALRTILAEHYENDDPVEIMFATPDPLETPLTATEIEAFKMISSHYPNTTVLNDSGAYMEVKYNADTKTFIENLLDGVSATRIVDVELLASAWEDTELSYLYAQVINIPGTTEFSQVNLNPSVEQMAIFYEKNLSFMTENEDGVVTVYAIGQKPKNDYVIQTAIREVRV